MAIDYDKLMAWRFPEAEHRYTRRDTILYALGVGLGADPLDERQLRFVYEERLQALPTLGVVLAYPGNWLRDPATGVDYTQVVHGEQSLRLHAPLPPEGAVIGRGRVTGIVDKGPGKGALIYSERRVEDAATGQALCTLNSTTFARGDGGFGGPATGPSGGAPAPPPLPAGPPDAVCDLPTLPQAALIYRLSGDYNPLHADPATAARAGFPRPILHGLGTFGVAGHALLRTLCGYRPERLVAMQARFSAPVFPGETLRTEIWRLGAQAAFRVRAVERDAIVLTQGRAELAA